VPIFAGLLLGGACALTAGDGALAGLSVAVRAHTQLVFVQWGPLLIVLQVGSRVGGMGEGNRDSG
jgi:hypothetical protein